MDHGVIFSFTRDKGPTIALPNGTEVYLGIDMNVPILDGYCNSDVKQRPPRKRTETSAMSGTADLLCPPCGQGSWPGTTGYINSTVLPEQAVMDNDVKDTNRSKDPPPIQSKPTSSKSHSAQQQRQPSSKRLRDDTTPILVFSEDTAIGSGHRSIATSVSAKQLQQKSGNTGAKLTYLDLVSGPFVIEAFSGSGRMAAAVRARGVEAFEFDLTEQGGRRNILHANVLHELEALIAHPICRGI